MTGNKEIDGILKKLSKYTGSVKVDLYPESKKPRIKVTAPDGSVDYFFMEDRDTFYWQSGSWNHGNVDAKKVVRTLIYVLVNYIYLNKIPDGETVQWGGHWFESDGKRLFYTQAQSVKKENKTLTDKEKQLVKEYAKKLISNRRLNEGSKDSVVSLKFANITDYHKANQVLYNNGFKKPTSGNKGSGYYTADDDWHTIEFDTTLKKVVLPLLKGLKYKMDVKQPKGYKIFNQGGYLD